jgi:hypothetical protein
MDVVTVVAFTAVFASSRTRYCDVLEIEGAIPKFSLKILIKQLRGLERDKGHASLNTQNLSE